MVKKLFTMLAALLLVAGAVPTAWAALADLGIPIDPHGYPAWYQDTNGLQLELCVPPPAGNASRPDLCIGDPIELDGDGNPISPLVLTGESFWWLAEAEIELPSGGEAELTLAVEATFGGAEEPIDGQQISFGRTRIRIDTPVAGTYTVTHPYGQIVFENVIADDRGINYTADIGAANFLNPAVGFRGTLTAPIGPFLTWPNYNTNPTLQVRGPNDPITGEPGPLLEQYIGNPNTLSAIVGSPFNTNFFRVDGPPGSNLGGPGIDFVETNLFSVMGKVFDPTVPLVAHVFPGVPERKLLAVGPVNRVTPFVTPTTGEVTGIDHDYAVGYPIWYQENLGTLEEPVEGVQLTLCTPGDPMCISDPINPTDLDQATLRTGGEGFWWSAEASFEVGEDEYQLVLALEATFGGDESLIDGQQISFGRERIRFDFDNDTPVATYRVTHPYGVRILEGDPGRLDRIRFTADIGITDPADPDGAFVGALYSAIGPQFLKWTTFNPDPALTDPLLVTPNVADPDADPPLSNYHVGNPGVPHAVVGSPFDTNFFRVERLVSGTVEDGNWVTVGETDLFSVSGKIFNEETFEFHVDPAVPVALPDTATLDMRTGETSLTIDVTANDSFNVGVPVTVTVVGQPADGTAVANNPVGTITYTPDADFAFTGGVDTFSYQISQTINEVVLTSVAADVTVTVIPVEVVTIDRARLQANQLRLDLRGTTNATGALTIYAGTDTSGQVLGTATPRNGRWNFRGTATSAITNITVATPGNATVETSAVQVR